jgi:hypothetical protein
VVIGLLAMFSGCANPFDLSDDAQWYSARVVRVQNPSDLDRTVNRRCVEGLDPMPEQVAVVAVRMHRAPHLAAFAIPAQVEVKDDEPVSVNFRLCQLRLRPVASKSALGDAHFAQADPSPSR